MALGGRAEEEKSDRRGVKGVPSSALADSEAFTYSVSEVCVVMVTRATLRR